MDEKPVFVCPHCKQEYFDGEDAPGDLPSLIDFKVYDGGDEGKIVVFFCAVVSCQKILNIQLLNLPSH